MTMAPRGSDPAGVELAYERIRAAIVESEYEPGQRLIEQKIAEEYALSRTPVREAIRRLEAEGLVVAERNRGAVVRSISAAEVRDLYELRARLESYAAELAASRITDEQLERLRAAVATFHSLAAAPPPDGIDLERVRRISEANREVHDVIVEAAHHERLATMLARTVDIPLVFRAFRTFNADELGRSDLFHGLILEAVESGDPARASRLMVEHISQGLAAISGGLDADDGASGS